MVSLARQQIRRQNQVWWAWRFEVEGSQGFNYIILLPYMAMLRVQPRPARPERFAGKAVPMAAKPAIDEDTAHATRVFMRRIEGRYPISEAILYGSRARRTHSADSDADIAVILKGPPGNRKAAALEMADLAFDVLLETGILVAALPLWEEELANPQRFGNPGLIQNIRREGVRL
jgi:predicted nucleotidyltransferase